MSAPVRAFSAPVTSRRVSAGITPPPGSTASLTVWWGRADWLEVEVRSALREHADVCKNHHVSIAAAYAVAAGMARFADSRTGRDCRPTNERLVEVTRLSLSTVQRSRRVLKELGLVVEVVAGRSNMTLAQRLAAHENGSSHRAIAAEFALCSRRNRRPRLVENPAADLQVVERDTPPVGKVVKRESLDRSAHLQSTDATRRAASRPAHTEKSSRRPPVLLDPATRRLVRDVKAHLEWLAGVPNGRLTPLLTPFAQADWGWRDVELAASDAIAARGWRGVPANLEHPWAYLAKLLRGVDPADRPSVLDDAHAAAERAHQRLVTRGAPCEHGVPGGDVVSPLTAQRGCPLCRAG